MHGSEAEMTIHIIFLEDENTFTKCRAFSTEDKAIAFAASQNKTGLWTSIDQYEVEVDGDEK